MAVAVLIRHRIFGGPIVDNIKPHSTQKRFNVRQEGRTDTKIVDGVAMVGIVACDAKQKIHYDGPSSG